ncbi:prolyl oligopeptidase family serine peptidase [Peijinzhouia sedimentorum]
MNKILSLFMCLVIFPSLIMAQGKKPLTHDVYDEWKSLGSTSLSNDGNWLHFTINPQEGDNVLEVKQLNGTASYKIDRAVNPNFTNDNRFVIFVIKPQEDLVKELKLKKTKAADMPKDSLGILNLQNGELVKKPMVKGYKLPKDGSGWLVYQTEPGANKAEAAEETSGDEKPKKPAPKAKGSELVLRNLATGEEQIVERTAEYIFTEPGNRVYFTKVEDDSVKNAGVWYFDTQSKALAAIDTGLTEYKGITAYKDGLKLGWHATADSTKAKEKYYSLFYWDNAANDSRKLVDTLTQGVPERWVVSDNGNINFSDNGNRIFFATAPRPPKFDYEQDTTILDEDRVKVDVWSWTDEAIQPMQKVQLNRELRRTYLAVYHLNSNKVVQLEDEDFNSVSLDPDRKFDIAIATDDSKYRYNYSWDIQLPRDVYTVDLNTGNRKFIFTAQGYPQASPNGKYLAWYEPTDSTWYSYTIASGAKKALTADLDVNFYDEIHDSPSLPGGYGSAGWLEDETAILVYDRHDIWKLDPSMAIAPVNLTNGHGRANDLRYRYARLDFEERSIPTSGKWYLSTFHYTNKQSGYSSMNANTKANPTSIVMGDYSMYGMRKAKDSDRVIFNRSTFTEYGEVYATNLQFQNPRKMSITNPQQSEYNWGTIELVEYTSLQGDRLQGLLIKPENFDPNKKYPLISYFYERSSDGLHSYRSPAPSASTINLTYFASNGYIVFVPDIKYDLGLPGPSAYDCIVPGVLSIVDRGFVDKDNMAIQGQSWGGYQVAYLVTQTNMFKAAGSGAPVVNMTSAYGGIRWGTGMSRMFQYEQTQSRIGGTLWEKPWYYVENSPLFYADRIKTPLLIMANDEDGAVPWYQGIEFYMALRRNNVPSWLLVYNGEDHNLRLRKNRKDLSIRLSQFFDHYLKGEPMPYWMKYGIPATEKGKTMRYELTEE